MKYFVYTFNYVTLHKAIIYGNQKWGIENTFIIYTTFNAPPPQALIQGKYNNLIVDSMKYELDVHLKGFTIINDLVSAKRIVREFEKYIIQNEPDFSQKICLVVFRDTRTREILLIDKIKKKYKNVEVILIEEGLALYAKTSNNVAAGNNFIKKTIFRLAGVPILAAFSLRHGYNPMTNRIICSRPQLLIGTSLDKGNNVEQQIDVFSKENCDFFITNVLMQKIDNKVYDYVFLTQPIFPSQNDNLNSKYQTFLEKLFSITSKYGTLLIKQHMRDTWDYSGFVSKTVHVCPLELSKCAFEVLSGHFGNPQFITLYSSAACNLNNNKPSIFLYDFFSEIINENIFTEQFIMDSGIIRCKTYDELEDNLCK